MSGLADTVIRGARVYTVDDAMPWAEAVAVRNGRIAWVGGSDDAGSWMGPDTEVIDAGGRMLLPGFVDTHNHVRLGSNPLEVDLSGAATLDEIKARVRAHADTHPEQPGSRASGGTTTAMPGGRLPTWEDLEGLTGDAPRSSSPTTCTTSG